MAGKAHSCADEREEKGDAEGPGMPGIQEQAGDWEW